MFYKKLIISILLSLIFNNFVNSKEIFIVSKVNDEIITNIDVENEKKYLLLLNNNLNKLSEIEFFDLSKDSLIREKIKKRETNRYFTKQNNTTENKIVENFYKRLGFDNQETFIKFLDKKKINFRNIVESNNI